MIIQSQEMYILENECYSEWIRYEVGYKLTEYEENTIWYSGKKSLKKIQYGISAPDKQRICIYYAI